MQSPIKHNNQTWHHATVRLFHTLQASPFYILKFSPTLAHFFHFYFHQGKFIPLYIVFVVLASSMDVKNNLYAVLSFAMATPLNKKFLSVTFFPSLSFPLPLDYFFLFFFFTSMTREKDK
jgi:hypothetical protein